MSRITLEHLHEHLLKIQQVQEVHGLLLRRTFRKVGKIMAALDTITAAVERIEGVEASVVKLITDLADEIRNTSGDPAAVQALADRLTGSADRMAAAVAANPDPTPNP